MSNFQEILGSSHATHTFQNGTCAHHAILWPFFTTTIDTCGAGDYLGTHLDGECFIILNLSQFAISSFISESDNWNMNSAGKRAMLRRRDGGSP
jgi:hypothetical protein